MTPDFFAQLDLTKINFPTDQLRVADLKRAYSHCFALREITGSYQDEAIEHLESLIRIERNYVALVFAKSSRVQGSSELDEQEIVDALKADYIDFGLAQGDIHATELVRSLQANVLKQARDLDSHR